MIYAETFSHMCTGTVQCSSVLLVYWKSLCPRQKTQLWAAAKERKKKARPHVYIILCSYYIIIIYTGRERERSYYPTVLIKSNNAYT